MYDELIEKIKPFIKKYPSYLVGGYLRDKLLGKTSKDRDIAIKCDKLKDLCIKIAENLDGVFVELDDENKIYRVVFGEDYVDFAKFENLEVDIDRRDFTINSIMYDIKNDEIIDKNNGREDFENKIIRTCSLSNLSDDYLRMLRAFRFQSALGFEIEQKIIVFVRENAIKLKNVAPERINQELIKIFEGKFLIKALLNMNKTGILEVLFPCFLEIKKIPKNSHHHLDLFHHLIETTSKIRINRWELKMAAFLHDLAKPDTWTIDETTGRHRFIGHDEIGGKKVVPLLKELKFSNKQIEYISKMIKFHIYPSALMSNPDVTEKAIIRFVRKIGDDTLDLIELARADRLSARGEAITDEIVNENLANLEILKNKYEEIAPKLKNLEKLIDGEEIMKLLNIKPSKMLGEIIENIKELQLQGVIQTKEDAIKYVLNLQ